MSKCRLLIAMLVPGALVACGEGAVVAPDACDVGQYGTSCAGMCACGHGVCDEGKQGTGACTCEPGFFGAGCDRACACQNGAACDEGASGSGACTCTPGFFGAACDQACDCQNGSICDDGASGSGACECPPGNFGQDCSGVCACQHNGVCADGAAGDGHCTCVFGWGGSDCSQACTLTWSPVTASPISTFAFGAGLPFHLWNDPIVLEEDGVYRMWMTAGDPRTPGFDVRIYQATSGDGASWQLNLTPEVELGPAGAFDDERTETPSVTRDGTGTYHLYYSGMKSGQPPGVYSIGHASSADGSTWTKDPANPVVDVVGGGETSDWGGYSVAEPAAVYNPADDTIYLYYVSFGGSADRDGDTAILLATSRDGSTFVHHRDASGNREPVWSLTPSYASTAGYRGYSTPAVTLGPDGLFHLMHDVVFDPTGFAQVALAYARSGDGINFTEAAVDIVVRGSASWTAEAVIAPVPLVDGDHLSVWFAGHGALAGPGWWDTFESGIGRIDGTASCP